MTARAIGDFGRPEDAPLYGTCVLCNRELTRSSYCCGCSAFVCWTHGEPPPDPSTYSDSHQRPWIPHAPHDHKPRWPRVHAADSKHGTTHDRITRSNLLTR